MAAATLDEIGTLLKQLAEETRRIDPAQTARLEALRQNSISNGKSEQEATQEAIFLSRLLREGIIEQLPIPPNDPAYEKQLPFTPVVVQGEPLSETVIRERR